MRHHLNRNSATADIWSQRNVVMACAAIAATMLFGTWMILHDTTAEARDIRNRIDNLPAECRSYASMSLRLGIITNSGPIDRDQVADILSPIEDLEPQDCMRINEQMDAIAQ